MSRDEQFTTVVEVKLTLLDILVLHGALQLALRHPRWSGPSAGLGVALLKRTRNIIVMSGLLTPEEIKHLLADEARCILQSGIHRS